MRCPAQSTQCPRERRPDSGEASDDRPRQEFSRGSLDRHWVAEAGPCLPQSVRRFPPPSGIGGRDVSAPRQPAGSAWPPQAGDLQSKGLMCPRRPQDKDAGASRLRANTTCGGVRGVRVRSPVPAEPEKRTWPPLDSRAGSALGPKDGERTLAARGQGHRGPTGWRTGRFRLDFRVLIAHLGPSLHREKCQTLGIRVNWIHGSETRTPGAVVPSPGYL